MIITSAQVVAEVRSLAAESPRFVYMTPDDGAGAACKYVQYDDEGNLAGCIVGQALLRLGLPAAEVQEYEGNPASTVVYRLASSTDEDLAWLDHVQEHQDSKNPWGESVEYADVEGDEDPEE